MIRKSLFAVLLLTVVLLAPIQAHSEQTKDGVKRSRAVSVAKGTTSDGASFAVTAQRETPTGQRRKQKFPRTCLSVRTDGPSGSASARPCTPFPSRTGGLDVAYLRRTGDTLLAGLIAGHATAIRAELADGRLVDAQIKKLPKQWGTVEGFAIVVPAGAQLIAVRAYDDAGRSTGGIIFPGG